MNNKICEILSDKFIRGSFILLFIINTLILFNIIFLDDDFVICLNFINGVVSIWCLRIIFKSQKSQYILSMKELKKFLLCNTVLLIGSFLYTEYINVYLIEKFFPVIGIAFLTIGVYKVKLYNSINFRKIKRGFLIGIIIYLSFVIIFNCNFLWNYISEIIIPSFFLEILMLTIISLIIKFILPYLILNWLEKNKDQIIADNKASHE